MCMPGMKEKECLNQFHERSLNPSVKQQNSKSTAIRELVKHLQDQEFLGSHTVAEVVKGGSLGKGTALKDKSDIDLVVFLNGFSDMEEFKRERERILIDMKKRLRDYQGLEIERRTPYSLKCKFLGEEVDILPTIKIEERLLPKTYKAIKESANPEEEGQNYSASLTKLQIDFVAPEHEIVKHAIRALKHWKKEYNVKIPSYALELIVIHEAREDHAENTRMLFEAVMDRLKDAGHLAIAFDDNYDSQQYTRSLRAPYVLDPANPFKNTLKESNINNIIHAASVTRQQCYQNPYL